MSQLRGVEHINGHTFQVLCNGAPPLRFEAHDAFTSKAWEHILGPALDKNAMKVPTATVLPSRANTAANYGREAPRLGGSGGHSPRPMASFPVRPAIKAAPKPAATPVDVITAYNRGWHINVRQRGLKQLGTLTPAGARVRVPGGGVK